MRRANASPSETVATRRSTPNRQCCGIVFMAEPPFTSPTVGRDAPLVVRHRLDREDLLRRLADRRATVLVAGARVGRSAFHVDVEAPDALAGRHDLAALAGQAR